MNPTTRPTQGPIPSNVRKRAQPKPRKQGGDPRTRPGLYPRIGLKRHVLFRVLSARATLTFSSNSNFKYFQYFQKLMQRATHPTYIYEYMIQRIMD